MKKLTLIITLCITLYSCSEKPVYVEYFKAGDILAPDYAISDTLVVVDAYNLNIKMGEIEQGKIDATDGEIANVFYQYCTIKN